MGLHRGHLREPHPYTGACIRGEFVLEGVAALTWGLYAAMITKMHPGMQRYWVAEHMVLGHSQWVQHSKRCVDHVDQQDAQPKK